MQSQFVFDILPDPDTGTVLPSFKRSNKSLMGTVVQDAVVTVTVTATDLH